MLVVSRKLGEKVVIGRDIVVTLVEVQGNRVKIGISAPDAVPVFREELQQAEANVASGDYPGRTPILQG